MGRWYCGRQNMTELPITETAAHTARWHSPAAAPGFQSGHFSQAVGGPGGPALHRDGVPAGPAQLGQGGSTYADTLRYKHADWNEQTCRGEEKKRRNEAEPRHATKRGAGPDVAPRTGTPGRGSSVGRARTSGLASPCTSQEAPHAMDASAHKPTRVWRDGPAAHHDSRHEPAPPTHAIPARPQARPPSRVERAQARTCAERRPPTHARHAQPVARYSLAPYPSLQIALPDLKLAHEPAYQ